MVLLVLVGFAGACLMAWEMPVVWRYEEPPEPHDGYTQIVWPLRIVVSVDPVHRDDVGLHAHEQVHVDQAQRFRPFQFLHAWLYKLPSYAAAAERQANRMQTYCATDSDCVCLVLQSTPVTLPADWLGSKPTARCARMIMALGKIASVSP